MNPRVRMAVLAATTTLAMALTAALGFWQLDRAAQKLALQAAVHARAEAPQLQNRLPAVAADALHRPARLQGRWLPQYTVYLDNRQMHGRVGYYVVTPLELSDTPLTLLVMRGWIPRNFVDRNALETIETPSGLVTVEGHMASPPGKLFELGHSAPTRIRQNLDVKSMEAEAGRPLYPLVLQQSGAPSEGLLREWEAVTVGVERHYGYAFQWFALCTLLGALFVWFQVIRPFVQRRKDSPKDV